jgi:hypothetical protein
MKIFIEVNAGVVTGVYTDDKETEIEVVLADYDNAVSELYDDENDEDCEFIRNCSDLEEERSRLREIY